MWIKDLNHYTFNVQKSQVRKKATFAPKRPLEDNLFVTTQETVTLLVTKTILSLSNEGLCIRCKSKIGFSEQCNCIKIAKPKHVNQRHKCF